MANSAFLTNLFGGIRPVALAGGFAALAIFATVFAVPSANTIVAKLVSPSLGEVDTMTTASITRDSASEKKSAVKRYIIRRSVLQKTPRSQCRIYVSGKREGDC